ncbi:hypothetical protein HYY74_04080 [Candidatus Woesearchaeota archaeon]|nr:hypothetical protein [Candidatus Woesearchaeota archaeon]
MRPKAVAIGASNTFGGDIFVVSPVYTQVLEELFRPFSKLVSRRGGELFLDLRNPGYELEDGNCVINSGVPGDTTYDMMARFEEDVLQWSPEYAIIQAGTNDIGAALEAMREPEAVSPGRREPEQIDAVQLYRSVIRDAGSQNSTLRLAAAQITENLLDMSRRAASRGIIPVVCTIPPYGNALEDYLADKSQPKAEQEKLAEGKRLISITNSLIVANCGREPLTRVADIHSALASRETGLMQPRYSHGDLVHLSGPGHIMVATVLANAITGMPCRIQTPEHTYLVS